VIPCRYYWSDPVVPEELVPAVREPFCLVSPSDCSQPISAVGVRSDPCWETVRRSEGHDRRSRSCCVAPLWRGVWDAFGVAVGLTGPNPVPVFSRKPRVHAAASQWRC
jgi:hypothetical protein